MLSPLFFPVISSNAPVCYNPCFVTLTHLHLDEWQHHRAPFSQGTLGGLFLCSGRALGLNNTAAIPLQNLQFSDRGEKKLFKKLLFLLLKVSYRYSLFDSI